MPGVEITVFGSFAVAVDGVRVPDGAWPSRRAAELVQLLALSDGHTLLRDRVIEALWPHLDVEAASANLRKAAHHARHALGDTDAVVLRHGSVSLFPGRTIAVDAAEFERRALAGDLTALDTYGGELLPAAVYEDWTQEPRRRLTDLYVDCLRTAGRWEEVVAADPLDEPASRELMREAMSNGSRAAALRWYGRLRRALGAELGVAPSAETEAVYAERVAGAGVPAPDLVGRDHELAVLDGLLVPAADRPAAVVLRGPGGIGKTALCRVFAERARASAAAVVTVEGAGLGDATAVGLGPIGVLPEFQGRGVGGALMHAVLGAADALDYQVAVLLGHLDYYPRFGFVPAASIGISPTEPEWGDHFQARPLGTWTSDVGGTFRYAKPFDAL